MTPALVCSLLLAAAVPKGPRAPADLDYAYYVPRLEDAAQLVPFLDAAGERSGLLRREAWRNEVHPLLRVDITRKDSLLASGLDPAGSGTLSFRDGYAYSCVSLGDVKKFEAACAERLKTLGEPFRKDVDGVTLVGAKDLLGRVLAGYALKGKESCALSAQGSPVEKGLPELAKLLAKPPVAAMWKTAATLPGQAFVVSPAGVVGLRGNGLQLVQEFKSARVPSAKLAGAGPSPYAGPAYDGLLWARLRVEPSQVALVLAQVTGLVARLCPSCEAPLLTEAATALAPALSGSALLRVGQVKVKGTLRTFNGRFFAAQLAMLAEASDPTAAREALKKLEGLKGAKALENGEGVSLLLREGEVVLGLRGSHLYFANDRATLDATLAAVPAAPGKQAHGAEAGLDPALLARALGQVPLADVLAVPELAAALAISAEGGPLMLASEKASAYADSDGSALRGQAVWTLKGPAVAAPDAGR